MNVPDWGLLQSSDAFEASFPFSLELKQSIVKPVFSQQFLVVSLFIKQEEEIQVKSRCVCACVCVSKNWTRAWVSGFIFGSAFNKLGDGVQLSSRISIMKGGTMTPLVSSQLNESETFS